MIAILIILLYATMIKIFGTEIGLLFATSFLVGLVIMATISKITGLDKKLDEWLEKE